MPVGLGAGSDERQLMIGFSEQLRTDHERAGEQEPEQRCDGNDPHDVRRGRSERGAKQRRLPPVGERDHRDRGELRGITAHRGGGRGAGGARLKVLVEAASLRRSQREVDRGRREVQELSVRLHRACSADSSS